MKILVKNIAVLIVIAFISTCCSDVSQEESFSLSKNGDKRGGHNHRIMSWEGIEDDFTYAAPTHVLIERENPNNIRDKMDTLDAFGIKILLESPGKTTIWYYYKYRNDYKDLLIAYKKGDQPANIYNKSWSLLDRKRTENEIIRTKNYGSVLWFKPEKIINHAIIIEEYRDGIQWKQYEVDNVYISLFDEETTDNALEAYFSDNNKFDDRFFLHKGTIHFPGGGD